MSWIKRLRDKPQEEKIKIIYSICGVAIIFLFLLWIFTSKIRQNLPKDTTLFKTLERGVKDIKENYKK